MAFEQTKVLLDCGMGLGKAVSELLEGQKAEALMDVLMNLQKIPAAIAALPSIPGEAAAASDQDRSDLEAYFVSNFQIQNQNVQSLVDNIVEAAIRISSILSLFKKA